MTTQELKEYINSKLGNSLRTLLPSYWWKRLFGLVVDRVEEVDNKVEDLKNNGSSTVTFYLTSDLDSEWAKKNYKGFIKLTSMYPGTAVSVLICTSHDEKYKELFTDICVTGGLEVSVTGFIIPKVQFGRKTCNIHITGGDNVALCEVERLTFVDDRFYGSDDWLSLKTNELSQEVADLSVSIPLYFMTECENAELRTSMTISESGPAYIFGFVGNSEIVDGKIKGVNLSNLTISAPAVPNYTLKSGWYNNLGVFENVPILNSTRTRICSSKMSVNPGAEYVIVSETNSFGIEIFEYDEQQNFIQKTLKYVNSEHPGIILAHSEITFAENTNYITFNLYYHGNDLTQTDIAFLDANQPFDEGKIHYGMFKSALTGVLHGLPAARDTRVGSALIRRVGERKYEEGDVNSDSLLTDGTTTIYALNPDEYRIETVMPAGIGFAGTAGGCTISSEIPVGFGMWSNSTNLYMTQMGSSSKSYDNIIYSQMLAKQDAIADLDTIRSGAALGATALQSYTEQYKGTVTGIKVNGSTHNPSNGVVDLGTISANESLRIHFEPNFDLEIGQHIDVTSLVQQSMGMTPAELYEEVVTNGKKTALFIHELMGGELQEISRVIDSLYEGVGLSYLSTLDGLPSPFQLIISTTQCQLVIVDMLAGYNSVVVPLTEMVEGKQEQLVSGTNIKTINGESILGSGDITVSVDLDGFINQEDLTNYHKYQSPYVVDWSADQSGTILHPGYYYFSDPTYLNLSGLPANPMGVYSIVLDNFSEDSSLNIVYPTNFRWTNGEPDFASLSGTTSVLELSILVLNDTDTVSNRKVLATWAIF